jgi:hypothetical protein
VTFPGYEKPIHVTKADLEKFYSTIEKKRKRNVEYTPPGIEILRCAYYAYQRETKQRPPDYDVYRWGWPLRDMMVLSGVRRDGV